MAPSKLKTRILSALVVACSYSCHISSSQKHPNSATPAENKLNAKEVEATVEKARVQKPWQEAFINYVSTLEAAQGWAFLSYSGMVDEGQHFLIKHEQVWSYYFVKRNYRDSAHSPKRETDSDGAKQWRLDEASWNHFKRPIPNTAKAHLNTLLNKFDQLEPVNQKAFDATEREYLHVQARNKQSSVVKRTYMMITSDDQSQYLKHLQAILSIMNNN